MEIPVVSSGMISKNSVTRSSLFILTVTVSKQPTNKMGKRSADTLSEKTKDQPTTSTTTTRKPKKIKSTTPTTTEPLKKEPEAKDNEDDDILSTKVPFIKKTQVEQAVKVLIDHSNNNLETNLDKGELFADQIGANDRFLNLVIGLKRITPKPKHKPIKIMLSHPLYDPRLSPVCLIVKDPQREYKDLLEEEKITFISKVVGINKLKGKHSSYEARRLLLNNHTLFLADERVLGVLPGILGTKFFKSNKLPIGIDITKPDRLKAELERAIGNTYLRLNNGSCLNIKVADLGRLNFDQILLNLTDLAYLVGSLTDDLTSNGRFSTTLTQQEMDKIKAAEDRIALKKEKKSSKLLRNWIVSFLFSSTQFQILIMLNDLVFWLSERARNSCFLLEVKK
ncbi:hypothetical protein PSHT_10565 [Puccinia striiformis]|uniref:Ribosomal protein L1 n=1 Tax=Puccinia striiformis TaxID=27350 RepID=A0A2S4V913_9BASI|nr:hypothetical protein PSHT_10565 [Puccinia striiformis]